MIILNIFSLLQTLLDSEVKLFDKCCITQFEVMSQQTYSVYCSHIYGIKNYILHYMNVIAHVKGYFDLFSYILYYVLNISNYKKVCYNDIFSVFIRIEYM